MNKPFPLSSIQGVLDFEPLLIKTDPGYQSFSHRVREVVKENEYPKTGKDVVSYFVRWFFCLIHLRIKQYNER